MRSVHRWIWVVREEWRMFNEWKSTRKSILATPELLTGSSEDRDGSAATTSEFDSGRNKTSTFEDDDDVISASSRPSTRYYDSLVDEEEEIDSYISEDE